MIRTGLTETVILEQRLQKVKKTGKNLTGKRNSKWKDPAAATRLARPRNTAEARGLRQVGVREMAEQEVRGNNEELEYTEEFAFYSK